MSAWAARAKASLSAAAQALVDDDDDSGGAEGAGGESTATNDQPETIAFGAPPPPAQPYAGDDSGEAWVTVCWGLQEGALSPAEFEVQCGFERHGRWRTAAIAECDVEKDEAGESKWVAVVAELEEGERYVVRVRAMNDAGWGLWSDVSEPLATLGRASRSSAGHESFGERDMTPHSEEEGEAAEEVRRGEAAQAAAEEPDTPEKPDAAEESSSGDQATPVLARFNQSFEGFASKARKVKDDASVAARQMKAELADHVSAALEEQQRAEEFEEEIVVPLEVLAEARELLSRSEEPVDMRSRRHFAQLRRLWTAAAFADGALPPQPPADINEAAATTLANTPAQSSWIRLGFQNDDPSSDFRGAGLLALDALVFFAEEYTAQYRAILAPPEVRKAAIGRAIPVVRPDGVSPAEEPGDALPVALTSINIT